MAETIGQTACPECGEPADLRQDKRGKLYIVHDGEGGCGRFTYNTLAGQERLKKRLADQPPVQDIGGVVFGPPVPAPDEGDKELAQIHGVPAGDEVVKSERNAKLGWMALAAGLALGAMTWASKRGAA